MNYSQLNPIPLNFISVKRWTRKKSTNLCIDYSTDFQPGGIPEEGV